MSCRDSIYAVLSGIGLYKFQKWNGIDPKPLNLSHVQSEIEAYIVGFQFIEDEIDSIVMNVFPQLADSNHLANFERLLAMPVELEINMENRRKMVLDRLSIGPNDFNKEGMYKALCSVGIDSYITELPSLQKIVIAVKNIIGSFLSLSEIKSAVNAVVPAHLLLELDTGSNSWIQTDFLNRSWTQIDALEKSWDDIEVGL